MDDLEFIKSFCKIHITDICKKLKIDKSNLYKRKISKENMHKVRLELEKQIEELKRG